MLQRFQTFVGGINCCYKYIQQIKSIEMAEFGLKGTHAMCLFFLNQHPQGLTAATLSQLCAEDKAAISRTIASLQKDGFIAVCDKKYRALLQLTHKGKQVAHQITQLIEQWVDFGSFGISDEDRAAFYRVLGAIGNNLKTNIENNERKLV
jgi:DNA-binding MarR family transcriptional regulator